MVYQKELYIEHAKSKEYEVCIWGAGFLGKGIGLQMLRKKEIAVNFYCDNNSDLWGREVVNGIKCISPMELAQRKPKIVCFLMMTNMYVESVLGQIQSMGFDEIILFDELFIEEKNEFLPFLKNKQTVFYTCIVGDYDELREPLSVRADCDYYLISDKEPEYETVFKYINVNDYVPAHVTDNAKKNR